MSVNSRETATISVIVHGVVQGVGFRFFVSRVAYRLGVSGWVKNLPDGAVEIQATGPRETLDELLDAVGDGPPGSRVAHIERVETETKETPTDFGGGFQILE